MINLKNLSLTNLTKKQRLLIIAVVLILLVSLLPLFGNRAKKTTLPEKDTLTQKVKPYFDDQTAAITPPSLETQPLKTATAYNLNPAKRQAAVNQITQALGFQARPGEFTLDGEKLSVWSQKGNSFEFNQTSGGIDFKITTDRDLTLNPLIEPDVWQKAVSWLQSFQLLPEKYDYSTEYLSLDSDELRPTKNKAEADFFRFFITPIVNDWTVYSSTQAAPIIFTLNNQGDIFSLSYQLPVDLFTKENTENKITVKIKNKEEVNQAIKQGLAIITQVNPQGGNNYPSPEIPLSQVKYDDPIELGYLSQNNQLLPVFRLSGTATLSDGQTVTITAYLPALAE